ncbi:hypothetical protein D030_4948A, partial [Vibrio parahaemolyticus AQ3810]|jgi:hypothetical protein
MEVY